MSWKLFNMSVLFVLNFVFFLLLFGLKLYSRIIQCC